MKKFIAVLLALILVFSSAVVAFAADSNIGGDVYTCPTCSKKWQSLEDYNTCIENHNAPAEEETDIYECGTCHKKFDNLDDYNACVEEHFDDVNYHYDKYINLTVVELINAVIDMFNSLGIKDLLTNIFEKASAIFGYVADSGVIPEVEA